MTVTARSPKILPPVDYLRECFDYDPEIGELRWRVRPRGHFLTTEAWRMFNAQFSGKRAGSTARGNRRSVRCDGVRYLVCRIATKMMTGSDPPRTVDHHDCDSANDRWENLRPATMREQQWNQGLRRTNTSGLRGVSRNGSGWRARINKNGVYLDLGTYSTPEEASAAYEAEARKLHGEFYREPGRDAGRKPALMPSSPSWVGWMFTPD